MVDGLPGTVKLATSEMYDPVSNTWTGISPMPAENWGMACVVLDNLIYLFGGFENEEGYWVYDPVSDIWQGGGELGSPRQSGFAGGLINGSVHLFGGFPNQSMSDAFDPVTLSWSVKSPMLDPLFQMGFAVYENRIYLFGGRNFSGSGLDIVRVYDPVYESR